MKTADLRDSDFVGEIAHAERLRDGYYALRRQTPALRAVSGPFEGQPWLTGWKYQIRLGTDGSQLCVGECDGDIEVCIIDASGHSSIYLAADKCEAA